jgi:RHS repeat-associated protein
LRMLGASRSETGGQANDYRFTGQQLDVASDLYYLRARYYDPAIGRFMTQDPFRGWAASPQSQNPYAYVMNNPANLIDPIGLCGITDPGGCLEDVVDCVSHPQDCIEETAENVGGEFKKAGGALGDLFGDRRVWRPLAGAAIIIAADVPGTALWAACIAGGGIACPAAAWYDVAVVIPATYTGVCLIAGENFFGIPVPGLDEFCRAGEEPKEDKE